MSGAATTMDALEATLEEHLRFVRAGARSADAWRGVRAHYGLAPSSHASGAAPPAEVAEVVKVVVLMAARHLESVQHAAGGADGARATVLWDRLARLANDEARAQEEANPPRAAALGLSSIFANATASVGKQAWSNLKYDGLIVLLCKSCGAPQEKTREFECAYCRGDLFRRPGE